MLDPKPGTQFEVSVADVIIPDVLVAAARDGTWGSSLIRQPSRVLS